MENNPIVTKILDLKKSESSKSESKSEKKLTANDCRKLLTDLQYKHGGFSNIPMDSEYWEIRRKYQSLRNK